VRRFLVELQYNGRAYEGWQAQPNRRTVQGVVEQAVAEVFGAKGVAGCSRTDSGVSAAQYFFHFDADTKLPADRVAFKLNRVLPKDVQAQMSREVAPTFHARHDCVAKTYEYAFYTGAHLRPLVNPHAMKVKGEVNLSAMREAAALLVGRHDFAAFTTQNAECNGTVRTIQTCAVTEDDGVYRIRITADGFLHRMMRNLAGMLLSVGKGETTLDGVAECLHTGKRAGWLTLPPKGLVLVKVRY